MDFNEENMTPKDMLEKIAELDYSQSQLRDMNSVMRDWLDVAEDEVAMLRSENVALRKQVKVQEKLISEPQQVEAESDSFVLTDALDVRRHTETKIQELEEESTMLKEQNKTLTSEIKIIQEEREQDKISLGKLQVALKTLEFDMEVAQVELQHKDGDIYQKDLKLKHLEETVEECSNIIKDLRQTNQELREQLEDRQDEALLSALNDLTEESEISPSPSLSILEEIKMLTTSDEGKTCILDSNHLKTEEHEAEEVLKPQSPTVDLQNERWTGTSNTGVQGTRLFLICISILAFFLFVAMEIISENCPLFSICTFWTSAQMMLLPYCSVHYSDLPPI
ncbi:coiled-coil domain-containing protein 14-like [Solea solea]|uniref:coiled-coil domain-containing protein 14-like n=1 Tax=Solea solea TaxID=90069 RepID=UPI00272A2356|nr:coiled-coil domain-containing protein 14-like [Solea solea]XP_058505263.1 coiled-coil domain-containing protein 14-like [Solea solea]XP_058505264.1 coiled-coil domain-containing protein 14-like [Solea solea]